MKVKKILWKYRPHQDGRCDIKIYVYHQGQQRNFSTGFAVPTAVRSFPFTQLPPVR